MQRPFQDVRAVAAVQNYVADRPPDALNIQGDHNDFVSLARFPSEFRPGKRIHLNDECQDLYESAKEWRSIVGKKCEINWVEGNHEYRWTRELLAGSDAFSDLDRPLSGSLQTWHKYLRLKEDFGINVYGPYGTAKGGFWVGRKGGLWSHHGDFSTLNAAKKHLDTYGCSNIFGHTHRLSQFSRTTKSFCIGSFEIGTLCDFKKTPKACNVTNWQLGFAEVWYDTDSTYFNVNLIPLIHKSFIANGKRYRP
jgi:hypothetical protein